MYFSNYLYFCSMKVVIAIDSFKGCLSSKEANEAAAEGIRVAYPDAEIIKVPLLDAFAKHGQWDDITAFKDVTFTIASDVKNPLYGEKGAAHVFAPQKGATPEMVLRLDEQARKFAELSAKHFSFDRSQIPGAGAAGGLGYAFLQYLDAKSMSGIQLLLDTIRFKELVYSSKRHLTDYDTGIRRND